MKCRLEFCPEISESQNTKEGVNVLAQGLQRVTQQDESNEHVIPDARRPSYEIPEVQPFTDLQF